MRIMRALTGLGLVAGVLLSTPAQAEIRAAVKNLTRTQSQSDFRDVELRAEVWDTREEWRKKNYTWTDWECDYEPGDSIDRWHGFFNLPKSDKPAALDAAIKGIGRSRAEKIVYSNGRFFSKKPRHWNAFVTEIMAIERELDLQGLVYDVLVTYGADNRRNLGYEYTGGGMNLASPPAEKAAQNFVSSDAWYGYFNLPKADKPEALSKAIRGIGQKRAESIVSCGGFKSKPDNWDEFKQEIRRIENSCNLNGLYDEVVAKYGSTNKANLYGGQGGGNGGGNGDFNPPGNGGGHGGGNGDFNPPSPPSQPTPPPVVCRPVTRYETIWVLEKEERFIEALTKRVDVYFENSVLLSGEQETISLRWDGKSESAQVDTSSAINRYGVRVDARGAVYTLSGEGRKAIRPALGDFGSPSFSNSGGKLVLDVRDARAEELIKLSGGKYALNVTFTLVQKGGTCSSDKVLLTKTSTINSGSGQIVISDLMAASPESGTSYQVTNLSFERLNTDFFSGSSGTWDSPALKY